MSAIIAVNDQTIVHLSLPVDSSVTYNGNTYTFGSRLSVNLMKYEIFQFSSKDDLSGTTILSNHPIAVISGHQLGNPSVSVSATKDMILEMLIPWKYWSTHYIAISNPVFNSGYGELIRIFTLCEKATVIIDKSGVRLQINVNQESVYEFPVALAESAVSSSHPYARSKIGDPRSVLPAPVDSWLNDYTFSTPGRSRGGSFNHGLVLVAYNEAINTTTLDNENLEPSLVWYEIAGTNLKYTVLPLSEGAHTLKCIGNLKCWGYVFGFGVYEEYGTSIGRSFTKVKLFEIKSYFIIVFINVCSFRINFNYNVEIKISRSVKFHVLYQKNVTCYLELCKPGIYYEFVIKWFFVCNEKRER
ncbi:unnamed protein product [Mytilus coruscus]|uniref:IgGFc-binding protein N-terminal domain-containing protein n=1 Tax=Mytilus coruscus TaxID=42192 RepID=A0A6J8CMK2_MYTCO|nr:unnamed protein product [Mytilus coruscus]